MRIIIIEDEYNLADAIGTMLKQEKYEVDIFTNGKKGLEEVLTGVYDLLILDVMLPIINGFEILKEIKKEKIDTKVIMLTAKNTIDDKMFCFNNGVDDYLTKPFHMDELLARVNIQLRKNIDNSILEYGNTKLDIKKMILFNEQKDLSISIIGKEFMVLELLMNNINQVLEKEMIFNKIWGYDTESDINSLEVYMSFIRKKLKIINSNISIKTIRNIGYKLVLDEKI